MSTSERSNPPSDETHATPRRAPQAVRRGFRVRRSTAATLLALSALVTACTPGEIQQSINMLNVSFEQGGLESGLSTAALIGQNAVLVIGMRLGSLGP